MQYYMQVHYHENLLTVETRLPCKYLNVYLKSVCIRFIYNRK